MKTQPLSKLLLSYGACDDAREWADARDYAAAWETCERGDWLLWIAAKVGVDRKAVVWAAGVAVVAAVGLVVLVSDLLFGSGE